MEWKTYADWRSGCSPFVRPGRNVRRASRTRRCFGAISWPLSTQHITGRQLVKVGLPHQDLHSTSHLLDPQRRGECDRERDMFRPVWSDAFQVCFSLSSLYSARRMHPYQNMLYSAPSVIVCYYYNAPQKLSLCSFQ